MKIRNLLSTAFMAIVASTANATDLYVYSLSSPTPVKQLNSIRYFAARNLHLAVADGHEGFVILHIAYASDDGGR